MTDVLASWAAEQGKVNELHELLQFGADADAVDEDGSTALSLAAAHGHAGCVAVLIAAGADVNSPGERRQMPPLIAACMHGRSLCVAQLRAAGANDVQWQGLNSEQWARKGEAKLFGHHSAANRPRCGAPEASPDLPGSAPGDIMPEVWPRQSGGGYAEYSAGTTVHARVKVVSLLVPGWRLLSQACSSIFATAQDGPSSERARDKHPDERLQSSGAALRSSVPVQASDQARVKVLSDLVRGRRLLNHARSAVYATLPPRTALAA